jgi:UDP-glucose 4-epimerase
MRVLVSGAAGFLGRRVAARLLERGHKVRAIVRPSSKVPEWAEKVEIFRADLRSHDNLQCAFNDIDAVVHLAAATSGDEDAQFSSTVVGTERFLEAMRTSSVKRLIHVSSLVVYDWSRARGVMDEDTPLLLSPYSMGAYAIAKIWQERLVTKLTKQHRWETTIMRPGFIWGRDHAEIAGMGRRLGRAYVMYGPLTRLPLTHVLNCADCVVAAVERPSAIGEIFNIVDSDEIRVWRYVTEYASRTHQRGILIPLPYTIGHGLAQLASLISRKLFGSRGKLPSLLTPNRFEAQFKPIRYSTRKLKQTLAWQAPWSFQDCLRSTYG